MTADDDRPAGDHGRTRGGSLGLVAYERKVRRDAAEARRRSLARKLGGRLTRKYLRVIPSVFGTLGEFAAFRLLIPSREALARLAPKAVLTLESATEILGGFRFSAAATSYVYLPSPGDLEEIQETRIGLRLPGTWFPMSWAPPGEGILFAVVRSAMPPSIERGGFRVVTPEFLIRELLGFHGLRLDLLARIEARIAEPYGVAIPGA